MKRKLFKKLAAAAAAAVMTLTLAMPMGVSAASSDYPAAGTTGSLTITKYKGDADGWDTSDTSQAAPSDKTPLGGVEFTILKVGSVSQETYTVTEADGQKQVTGLLYTITDTDLLGKLDSLTGGDQVSPVAGNKYTSTDLDKALKALYNIDENVADDIVSASGKSSQIQTTASVEENGLKVGQAKFSDLEQGLYLVAETAAPPEVTTKSVPFFVSIPSVVNDQSGNTQWEMNINAYPKNSTSTVDVDKEITKVDEEIDDINGNKDKAEATIGDIITYEVPVTAVVPADGLNEVRIVDTMSKGLTLVNIDKSVITPPLSGTEEPKTGVVEVYSVGAGDVRKKLTETTDYTVKAKKDSANKETTLTVEFTDTKINDLNSGDNKSPKFVFVYKAKLNEEAIIGTTGNKNEVKFVYEYGNNITVESEPKTATVYTWGIEITKIGEEETSGETNYLADVEFNLYKDNMEGNPMKFTSEGSVYKPSGAEQATDVLKTDASGKITVKGLEAGTYILKEKETKQGYVLLKDTITITITDTNNDGNATATIKNGSNAATEVTMKPDGTSQSALVPITVVNNKGFDLPETGAAGTAIFAIAGIALVAGAGALLLFRRKSHR